jgi:hypothetical protein
MRRDAPRPQARERERCKAIASQRSQGARSKGEGAPSMMSLNDLYLISQIAIAAIGVPTLIFLAVQVRQNTRQLRANAAYQFLETNKDLNIAMVGSRHAAGVYVRGIRDFDSLDEAERLQFILWTGQYYQTFSNMHDLWKAGLLPETAWRPVRKHLIDMLALPGARHVWEAFARDALPADFIAYGDRLSASNETSYSLMKGLGGPGARAP